MVISILEVFLLIEIELRLTTCDAGEYKLADLWRCPQPRPTISDITK